MPISPTAEAFRAAFRRPSSTFAEIIWRWVVGATATVLLSFGFLEYLDTLPVTNGELLFLRTRNPFLVSQAIAHILHGSLNRAVLSMMTAALLLALIWIVAASLARIAILDAIINYFRARFTELGVTETDQNDVVTNVSTRDRLGALLWLNFLRISAALAGLVGLAGAAIVAGSSSSPGHPRPGMVFLLFVPLAGLVGLVWYELNWLLSLAAVFVVRYGEDAVSSISSAVALCRDRTWALFAVSTWTGAAHLIAFFAASSAVAVPLGLAGFLPWRLVVLATLAVTLGYFAVADWLYVARLAGYVCIAELPNALLVPPVQPVVTPAPTPSSAIDRDELILSDVPNPVTA